MVEQIARCLAIRADLHACSRKFACEPDSHGTTERSFIEFHNFRAIGYYKDLLSLEGAVQPTIPDGITNTLPAFGGDKDHWILWMSMPDTNQLGHPISPLQFQLEWVQPTTTPTNDPHKDLLHHLFQIHAAELRSVGKGTWTKHHGQPPEPLFHPQFSVTEEEKNEMLSYKKGMHTGKGKGKGKRPASGGKGHCHSETPMWDRFGYPNFQSRILSIQTHNTFWVWEGSVMSLPRLMHCLGTAHSVADIYSYWNSLNIIATHRPHAWSKPARREAAFERMRETGHWRHRD